MAKIQEMKSWTHCLVLPHSHSYDESSTAVRGEEGGIVPVSIVETPVPMRSSSGDKEEILSYAAVIQFRGLIYRCCVNWFPKNGDGYHADRKVHADLVMESIWKFNGKNRNGGLQEIDEVDQPETTLGSSGESCAATTTEITTATSWEPHFHRLHFPIDLPLNFYLSWTGHSTQHGQDTLETTTQIYNRNVTHIPLPSILSLLSQQLLQPLFLFQLFCVILWSLDEYWMYALFTLFSLIMFEWTMAYNRWKGVKRLRDEVAGSDDDDGNQEERGVPNSSSMSRSPSVECFRNGKWISLSSKQLVVGDIVSLVSPTIMQQQIRGGRDHEQGNAIPADLLLLSGRAVVNEAMLTGESVPQVKESIRGEVSGDKSDEAQFLDLGQGHKRCVLFGGTVLMDHHAEGEEDESDNTTMGSVIRPPSNGLVCFVLRTGFDTIQGSLLRSLAYRAESGGGNAGGGEGVNSKETFLFLALLLLFALVSASTVVQHAWGDVTRNHFKLILHVIIIITSVIPPELPMELSLAVTSSLSELIKRCQVYCTEPVSQFNDAIG
jgi:cation-transporting ATPase 13A1